MKGEIDSTVNMSESKGKSPNDQVSHLETFKLAVKEIRLEPICALHMTSAVMVSMIAINLMMERACTVNIAASRQDCDAVLTRNFTADDERFDELMELGQKIQTEVASHNVWRNAIEYSFPVLYMLVMGNWSDKHGRKPILLLPVIGYMITNGGLLLSLYYEEWSVEVIAVWTSLPLALTGSSSLFGMAAYSWVGDTSTQQLRTVRIGLLSCGWFLGTALGMSFGGHLYQSLQFKGIFILAEALELAAFVGILFLIKNTRLSAPPLKEVAAGAAEAAEATATTGGKVGESAIEKSSLSSFAFESSSSPEMKGDNNVTSRETSVSTSKLPSSSSNDSEEPLSMAKMGTQSHGNGGKTGKWSDKTKAGRSSNKFLDLFDVSNVTQAFRTALKRREGNKRAHILILFIVLILGLAPTAGETSVLYLFVIQKLNWGEKEYGNFGTYMLFIATLGTFLSMGLLSYLLKLPDPLIGIVSCCSQMAAAFVYGFATKSWMMYLAPLIDSINGTVTIVTRSMGSKLVDPDELGRLNAFFGIGDALVPLVANTLYNALYTMTLTSFPGAFFLVSAAITVPVLLIFAWFYWQVRKEQNEELKTDGTAEEGGDSTDSEASGSHTPEKERF